MTTKTISYKEIRNDLDGFVKKLSEGQSLSIMYRSKPKVTVVAKEEGNAYLNKDAGTPTAIKRSVEFIRSLPDRPQVFDSSKSFKELYKETQKL